MPGSTEQVKRYNRAAGAWETVEVPAYAPPPRKRPAARRGPRKAGTPRDLTGLSDGSPFAGDTRQWTAYDQDWAGFADMRTYLPDQTIKTHRAPTVMPSASAQPAHMTTRELRGA